MVVALTILKTTAKNDFMHNQWRQTINQTKGKPAFFIFVLIFTLLQDQASKHLAENLLQDHQVVEIFSWFNLTLAHNPGVAFSFLADQGGWQRWFFMALSSIISLFLIIWIKKEMNKNPLLALGLTFILSGALGNLIDRTLFGHVIDFIQWHYQNYYWPTFNLADTFIFMGAVLLIYDGVFPDNENSLSNQS